MSLLWNLAQSRQIADVRLETGRTASKAREATENVRQLEQRIDRLALICRAMWTLLREATNLTEDALVQRVYDLDLTDGELDGEVRRPPVTCPKCGKVSSKRFDRCMWCGADLPMESAFDQV